MDTWWQSLQCCCPLKFRETHCSLPTPKLIQSGHFLGANFEVPCNFLKKFFFRILVSKENSRLLQTIREQVDLHVETSALFPTLLHLSHELFLNVKWSYKEHISSNQKAGWWDAPRECSRPALSIMEPVATHDCSAVEMWVVWVRNQVPNVIYFKIINMQTWRAIALLKVQSSSHVLVAFVSLLSWKAMWPNPPQRPELDRVSTLGLARRLWLILLLLSACIVSVGRWIAGVWFVCCYLPK